MFKFIVERYVNVIFLSNKFLLPTKQSTDLYDKTMDRNIYNKFMYCNMHLIAKSYLPFSLEFLIMINITIMTRVKTLVLFIGPMFIVYFVKVNW